MTAFQFLDRGLVKDAGAVYRAIGRPVGKVIGKTFGRRAGAASRGLMRRGSWGQLNHVARRKAVNGSKPWGVVRDVSGVMRGTLGQGLGYYGMAGMINPNLPLANAAMMFSAPGLSGAFTAPSAITAGKMMLPGTRENIKRDALSGAQEGAQDFITATSMDPSVAYQKNRLGQFMQDQGVNTAGTQRYLSGQAPDAMSRMRQIRMLFANPSQLVQQQVDRQAFNLLQKQANPVIGALGKVYRGVGSIMPWAVPTALVGSTAAAVASSPYDKQSVVQQGYDASQAAIQKGINGMNFLERSAARLDPSIVAQKINQKVPGVISGWEQHMGQKFTPGWLSGAMNNMAENKGRYYETDAAGTQHFLT